MAVIFSFQGINATVIHTNAGIFLGENNQSSWDSHQKRVFGVADIQGVLNISPGNIVVLSDNDMIDTPINDPDFKPGTTVQGI